MRITIPKISFLLVFLFPLMISGEEQDFKSYIKKFSKKELSKVHFKIYLDHELISGKEFQLKISKESDKEEFKKSFEMPIQSGDYIRLPEGLWKFKINYKYGVSGFNAEYFIIKNKKFKVDIQLNHWLKINQSSYLAGRTEFLFDKNDVLPEQQAWSSNVQALDFYCLGFKGSYAKMENSFLGGWIYDFPLGGRIRYLSSTPFAPSVINFETFFSDINQIDSQKHALFYFQPGELTMFHPNYIKNTGNELLSQKFKDKDRYHPFLGVSLPYCLLMKDVITGLDIDLSNETDLQIWFSFLNQGYQLPAISSYTTKDKKREPSWLVLEKKEEIKLEDKFKIICQGNTVMTTGPLLKVEIGDVGPGQAIVADNRVYPFLIQARTDPTFFDQVKYFEIIRNGKVIKKIEPTMENNIYQIQFFHVFEKEYAWYVVKLHTTRGNIAISNPIYFLPKEMKEPATAETLVKLNIINEKKLPVYQCGVKVVLGDKILFDGKLEGNQFEKVVPFTSKIIITHSEYLKSEIDLSKENKLMDKLIDNSLELKELVDVVSSSKRMEDIKKNSCILVRKIELISINKK